MRFHWEKLGLVYAPDVTGNHSKLLSHASNPLAINLHDDVYRIFFSARDSMNRSSVGGVDFDLSTFRIVEKHYEPFATFKEGTFYSHGLSIGSLIELPDERRILFMGWHVPEGGHWEGKIGSLEICKGPRQSLINSENVFLDKNETDPISLSYPWVHRLQDGTYRMWYGSTKSWSSSNGEMVHTIDLADSIDGINWNRRGVALPYKIGVAQAFSRPTVYVHESGNHYMWFSYRSGSGQSYRIGMARSENGTKWDLDLVGSGIDVSESGWDSEMIEYPFVFKHNSEVFMLYNGNGFGKTGFGLAKLHMS